MTAGSSRARDEAQIRGLIDTWAEADSRQGRRRGHVPLRGGYRDVRSRPATAIAGADALRRSLAAWFPTFRGPVGYEVRDLSITADGDVAFCRSLNRISGTRTDGEETDVWVRATVGLRRIDGRWQVTHEHSSVPFYMDGSYRAAVDLEP